MPTRTISTRLAIEGESEYRSKLAAVNAELRNSQAALKMVDSAYKNNAGSIEHLTARQEALKKIQQDNVEAIKKAQNGLENAQKSVEKHKNAQAELERQIAENDAALKKFEATNDDTSEAESKLTEENKKLKKELELVKAYVDGAERGVREWTGRLTNAQTALNNTNAELENNERALKESTNATRNNADAINALAAAMIASGLKQAIREITEALTECVDASVEFESAMAGVAKTTNMSADELAAMGDDIKKLSTDIPITATELAGIVEVAGQLGIAKEDLLSFSTVMANLGVSTDMTSEEAATMLARFANVTKMAPQMYENLGSVVVALGNNFATTESEIVTMGQRLAAAGELAGLTEPEIMALAAAMSSVGIEAEAGGTAMTQTLTAMEKAVATGGSSLEKFASVAGMSAEQFASTWESKPIEAIDAFISGLGRLDEQGESATLMLEDMGLKGIRQGNMLKSLASASGLLTNAVGLANTAWTENTALMTEANTRYQTTESQMTMFKNSVTALKIAIGDQLTPALHGLLSDGSDAVKWATEFVEANQWLGPALASVSAGLGGITAMMAGTIAVTEVIIPLVKTFNATLTANPALAVATAIVTLTAALGALALAYNYPTEEADKLRNAMAECNDVFSDAEDAYKSSSKEIAATARTVDAYIDRLSELEEQGSLTTQEQAEYNRLVGEISRIMPDANTAIDETTGLLENGAEALRANADSWREMAMAAAEVARIEAVTQGLTDAYVALYTAQDEMSALQANASEQTLAYAEALQAVYAAQENLSTVQRDATSSYWDIEAAQAALDDAQNKLIESASGLTDGEKETGVAIAALKDELGAAEETVASYEEKLSTLEASMASTGEAAQETADGIERTSEALQATGEVSGEAIASGFDSSMQAMPESATAKMAETEQAIISGGESIKANIADIATQSAESFDTELGNLKDSANKSLSDTITTVNGYSSQAYNAGYGVGAAISQGASAGVMAYAAQVAAAAAQMVRNAITAANQAAQINSPSKLTRKTGQGLDEGMIYGIRDLEDEVIKQMEETMGRVTAVEVEAPKIPDMPDPVFRAMDSGANDRMANALNNASKERPNVTVNVTQYIYAEDTSYAGQQREAKRQMKEIAREISR